MLFSEVAGTAFAWAASFDSAMYQFANNERIVDDAHRDTLLGEIQAELDGEGVNSAVLADEKEALLKLQIFALTAPIDVFLGDAHITSAGWYINKGSNKVTV